MHERYLAEGADILFEDTWAEDDGTACASCGRALAADALVCPGCGARVERCSGSCSSCGASRCVGGKSLPG